MQCSPFALGDTVFPPVLFSLQWKVIGIVAIKFEFEDFDFSETWHTKEGKKKISQVNYIIISGYECNSNNLGCEGDEVVILM